MRHKQIARELARTRRENQGKSVLNRAHSERQAIEEALDLLAIPGGEPEDPLPDDISLTTQDIINLGYWDGEWMYGSPGLRYLRLPKSVL